MADRVYVKRLRKWRYLILCDNCAKQFYAQKSHARYCGPTCRKVASRALKRVEVLRASLAAAEELARRFARRELAQVATRQRQKR